MSGYIGTQPVPQATQTRQTFVATAAQTSFATAGYSVGYLDVFLNGVKLQDGVDYTATNGSDIVLTVGAALDDTLEVVAYTAFEVADVYTKAETYTKAEADAGFVSDPNGAVTVDGSGNVGIGTSPSTSKLAVYGSGAVPIRWGNTSSLGELTFSGNDPILKSTTGNMLFYNGASESMRIDSSGRVTMPYQPSFRAYNPVSGASSVSTTIIWGSTYHNTGNHFNTSTGVFTAPVAGIYAFTANTLIRYDAALKYHRIEYEINGVHSTLNGDSLENQAGPNYSSPSLSIFIQLSAGDTLSVYNGPTQVYGVGYGSFSGILIG